MSNKRGKKQQVSTEEDDLEFLLAAAAQNKAKKEAALKQLEIPDSVFEKLPPAPSVEYPDGKYPTRDFIEYNEHVGFRPKNAEQEKKLAELEAALPDLREGGLAHEKVREWSVNAGIIKPGVKLYDMCAQIEEAVRREVHYSPPTRGLAFPCGCSLNNVAAHYSPLYSDDQTVLGTSDVMKIDFGVAINGHIIDSAFTVCFDERFKPLIEASREATNKGIRMAGPDARISEIAAVIDETISSYQLELDGKIYPIRPVENLTGHQMKQYTIHAGKFIPIAKPKPGYQAYDQKMEIGELYALETFATTGSGIVHDDGATSHFMIDPEAKQAPKGSLRDLEDCIRRNYKTMAFCQRFLERDGEHDFKIALDKLVHSKIVNPYPPLADVPGSYVSQHEHCFGIFEKGIEVVSRTHE
ncbi:Clan MG, family M24, aminopeptidase P-like metallopeptidase [Tritrichomonas foetus]|uniref:Clan MG, family M24, aminopeptidase P-like metallopeptidase n=1 Tax=Tritrichomonas foetus TaxID=1144522 RepID=A0A1J4J929_9EUKA|nr:Clan MG, family M24, aminopeptidase P-like metallopeptidase [Tritrichomonas foetus]|eukprot:OHS93917.1 Clan MG, family M24, aminopeptidase P-like metallopeptidase [Tritrichomonas foetus]